MQAHLLTYHGKHTYASDGIHFSKAEEVANSVEGALDELSTTLIEDKGMSIFGKQLGCSTMHEISKNCQDTSGKYLKDIVHHIIINKSKGTGHQRH